MAITFTKLAEQRFAARDAGGPEVHIDNVRVGNTVSYDATGDETALKDPRPVRYNLDQISLTANEGRVVSIVELDYAPAQRGQEAGFFDGNDLLIIWSTQGENVFLKAANTQAIISLVYRYRGRGTPTALEAVVNLAAPAKASRTVALQGQDDELYMTAYTTAQAIAASTIPDARIDRKGKVELSTSAELQAALRGTNPPASVRDNVVTLQTIYDERDEIGGPVFYIRDTDPQAAEANTQLAQVWMIY